MSGISAIGNSYGNFGTFSSTQTNAADIAIEERLQTQATTNKAGTENITYAQSAANITDSALGDITDYLQSIRELGVRAKNGTLSADDVASIQGQVDQYLQGINDVAENTVFNENRLLDGSNTTYNFATDGNGSQVTLTTPDSTIASLGLSGLDVTSSSFFDDVDKALETVNNARSTVGAQSNIFEHAWKQNLNSYENLVASTADPLDDMVKTYQERQRDELLKNVQFIMQKKDEENKKTATMNLFA